MKWTIIHPSRKRCQRGYEAALSCINNFDNSVDTLEYIVSIDNNDDQAECYREWTIPSGIILISNNNRSLVDACNNAAKIATGDCFLVLSDDFLTPPRWNELLKEKECKKCCLQFCIMEYKSFSWKNNSILYT